MLEINLLPKELRKRKIEMPDISFLPVLVCLLGLIIVVHLLFSAVLGWKAGALRHLEARWKELKPQGEAAAEVIGELTDMRAKINAIDELISNRLSWAKKLSDLSGAVIPGVWLNRLWIEKKAVYAARSSGLGAAEDKAAASKKIMASILHLNGSVIVTGGEETAAVGKFMYSLENNPGFFEDFDKIESAYMQRVELKEVEVMNFELLCYFKEGR